VSSATGQRAADRTRDGEVEALLEQAVTALGGAPREGQTAMARAVAAAAADGEHLLVQAGTGTGKSLAYLVPLAAHAVRARRPAVVSTATLALQRQVVERDLPLLAEALRPALGRELTFEVVKGRANYVCRQKLGGGFPEDPGEDVLFEPADPGPSGGGEHPPARSGRLGREVRRVRAWAEETATGDRDELVPGVSDRAWRQVSVSARECLGASRCPVAEECHVELGRARSRDVDVVVTNHALLAIDAVEGRSILPEHDVVVVDEAHELAQRVTSVAAGVLSAATVATAAGAARRGAEADTARLETAGEDLAAVLEDHPGGRLAQGLPEPLLLAVAGVRDAAREALSSLKGEGGGAPGGPAGEADGGRQVARAALTEVFDVAERLAQVRARGEDVAWVEASERGGTGARALHVAPLSVAGVLRERLFATRTVVLTSATLAVGGSFEATAAGVGLGGEDGAYTALDVASPFDYPRQGILYVAAHLPPPGRDGAPAVVLDELAALVTAAGGRTLGLFSSRRAAEAAAEAMRARLDVPVLCQGDDATPTLVRAYADDEATCLFGTLSLWQGVDVPGPACQLVVVDRIPFPRPDDPLSSARTEAVARAGGNGFMAVSAAHAALLLAQGAGRLVRTTADRGVVAVLDPRLASARYAGFLRASLPPLWPTTDRALVLSALARIDAGARAGRPNRSRQATGS
jgi:ATP-dependent DNA helicase DinG